MEIISESAVGNNMACRGCLGTFNGQVRKVSGERHQSSKDKEPRLVSGCSGGGNCQEGGPGKTKPPRLEQGWLIGGIKRSERLTHGECSWKLGR